MKLVICFVTTFLFLASSNSFGSVDCDPEFSIVDDFSFKGIEKGAFASIKCKDKQNMINILSSIDLASSVISGSCALMPELGVSKITAAGFFLVSVGFKSLTFFVHTIDCDYEERPISEQQTSELLNSVCTQMEKGYSGYDPITKKCI